MTLFSNGKELLDRFGDVATLGFFDPVVLNDTRAGFSIKRDYPSDIRYKPAIGQKTKQPDNVAAIWVVYQHPGDSEQKTRIPLRLRVSSMSRYRTKHWDYDYNDVEGDCPSKDSVEASAATPVPIELEYPGEFFFDHAHNCFYDKDGNQISGREILDRVFQDHCRTIHLFWGLRLRAKLYAQNKLAGVLSLFSAILVWVLKNLFGHSLEDSDIMAGAFRTYKLESLKKYDADSLDVLGYKASKQVVILFCFLAILLSYYRYKTGVTDDYFASVGGSEFLSLVHGIFSIWVLDALIPLALFGLINCFIWLRTTLLFLKF
jgi:hypothetical protein